MAPTSTGIVQITDALLDLGFGDADIARIMGGNAMRLMADALPDGPRAGAR